MRALKRVKVELYQKLHAGKNMGEKVSFRIAVLWRHRRSEVYNLQRKKEKGKKETCELEKRGMAVFLVGR